MRPPSNKLYIAEELTQNPLASKLIQTFQKLYEGYTDLHIISELQYVSIEWGLMEWLDDCPHLWEFLTFLRSQSVVEVKSVGSTPDCPDERISCLESHLLEQDTDDV